MQWLLLFAGGGIGAVLRFGLAGFVQSHTGAFFPWGTLAVNVTGCLAIGLLATLAEQRGFFDPNLRLFLGVGVLGGFTTFSTFGLETWQLLQTGELLYAGLNALGSIVAALVAVIAGVYLARLMG